MSQYGCLCGMKWKFPFCVQTSFIFLIKGIHKQYIYSYILFLSSWGVHLTWAKVAWRYLVQMTTAKSTPFTCLSGVVEACVKPLILTILQVVSAFCWSMLHLICQHAVTTKHFFIQDTRSPIRCRKYSVGFVWRTLQTDESLCWQIVEVHPSANHICLTVNVQVQHFPLTSVDSWSF